jgi:HEAT repeat protein
MYNYHADLIWLIDKILLYLVFFAVISTVLYAAAREYFWRKRSRALLKIKGNIYELALSGLKADSKVCPTVASGVTTQQFLDVATNRSREMVFFNDSEQSILKSCFVSAEKLTLLERTAVSSWSKWRRAEAILTLGHAQVASALKVFKKTIYDKDPDISYFSVIALGQIKNMESAGILLDFIQKEPFYRYRIFSFLESFPSGICGKVVGLSDSPDPEIRNLVVKLICGFKAAEYSGIIEKFVSDEDARVRASACYCLGEFGENGFSGRILKCLNDDSWMVRASAVGAFFKVRGKEGLPEIMGRINDGSLSVIESLKALITNNIEACLFYLEKFLNGNDEMARRVSVEALEASGYTVKLLQILLAGGGREKEISMNLLKGLIASRAYLGLRGALSGFPEGEKRKLLEIIRGVDKDASVILEEKAGGF